MARVNDQNPIEQFTKQHSDHPLTDRVRLGCSGRTGEGLDTVRGEDCVEPPGEPGVVISEQECDAGGAVGEVHRNVAGGWSDPCPGWVRGHAEQMCPAGAVLHRDQRIDPPEQHRVSTCTKSTARTALA